MRTLQQRRPSVATAKMPGRRSSRLDSVYAVYAEMYPELDEDDSPLPNGFVSREDERGTSLSSYTAVATKSPKAPLAPWDERGATGLYGGGGRGADDKETGWARNFAFDLPASDSGFEEDLRFEEDTSTRSATPLASPRSERAPSPVTSASGRLSDTTHSASSLRLASEVTSGSEPPESAPEKALPVHKIDAVQVKKQHVMSAVPTPSEPALASPKHALRMPPKLPRTPTLKWRPRSKKPLSISTPILPPGFVESLGMETFPLHPVTEEEEKVSTLAPSVSAAPPTASSSPVTPTVRTLTPPRTPSIKRELALNPKLSPVGFGRDSVSSQPTSSSMFPVAGGVSESDETSRGYRVQVGPLASWSGYTPADYDGAPSPTLAPSCTPRADSQFHVRGDSSVTANNGFRDPWATSTSAAATASWTSSWSANSHLEASVPSHGWHGGYPHFATATVPPQRFREDSVASHYSDSSTDAHAIVVPTESTYRRSQPLSVVRRGENTYSFASLSPSTCGPDAEGAEDDRGPLSPSWRFPAQPPVPAGSDVGMSGFRNPFS